MAADADRRRGASPGGVTPRRGRSLRRFRSGWTRARSKPGAHHRAHGLSTTLLLLLLLPAIPARAAAPGFDQTLATRVFAAAFRFMAPRALTAVSAQQLSEWGLHGITALAPDLTPQLAGATITLTGPSGVLAKFAVPSPEDADGWAGLVAAMNAAAYHRSAALRRAGTQGVIESFFDEMFNHLDPYSRYVGPVAAAADRDWRNGVAGIGVALAGRRGDISIGKVVSQGPADLAGLRAGDVLRRINGVVLRDADPDYVLAELNGPPGSVVELTVRRGKIRQSVTLTRADVPADTVALTRDDGLLVLHITGFTASTADLVESALRQAFAETHQPAGVVLDLRGNRGGLLSQAVGIASALMNRGVIATTIGRDRLADHQWVANGPDLAQGVPMAVLVDGRTASAAEVLAAALSDNGRAMVVGSATYGKGLVQTIGPMPDGGELFITWSRLLAPDGWPLQSLGVMPELCTSLGQDATDQQLQALANGTSLGAGRLALHRRIRPETPLAEIVAVRNTCPADLGHATDMAAARFLIGNPVAYASGLAPL